MSQNKKAILEGLLFASGEEGMSKDQLAEVLETSEATIEKLLAEWKTELEEEDRGLRLMDSDASVRLTTKPEYTKIYKQWVYRQRQTRLSRAALEVLAIIAYKQPITRVEIDDIRGVKSDQSVQTLLSRGMIRDAGRKDTIGRPILYETTNGFLIYFGLPSLEDLPQLEDVSEDNVSEAETFFDQFEEE